MGKGERTSLRATGDGGKGERDCEVYGLKGEEMEGSGDMGGEECRVEGVAGDGEAEGKRCMEV